MKQKQKCKTVLLLLIILLLRNDSHAQSSFIYKARLDTITQSGFYNIALTPTIIAKCKNELEDIRIKDDSNQEAPYILYIETAQPNEESFTEFPLSYSENRSAIIINNILPNSISKLFLLIKNSEAKRIATLSGSDDAMHWFVVKENIVLQNEYTADSDAFVQLVSFLPSSYKYFRITMPGKNILPLNIVKAGVYRPNFSGNVYDTMPLPNIIQHDSSDKKSYCYLSFAGNYAIDKINLFFSGSKYYKRGVAVYDKNTVDRLLMNDTVFSERQSGIEFHAKTNRLLVVIDNKDNVPLSLQRVTAFGLHTSVTAYLEKGRNYTLFFGDSSAIAPSYDLEYFNDSIGNNIQSLHLMNIEEIKANVAVTKKESNTNQWMLWSIIVAVLLLLLYFSFRMIKDISHKTDKDAHL